jgi:hypothetical protein
VYKFVGDLHFYATADAEENEIILAAVLSALVETVSLLLKCVRRLGCSSVASAGPLRSAAPCPPS